MSILIDKSKQKRIVLALDLGCARCSAAGKAIHEIVGEKLEIQGLASSCVREWSRLSQQSSRDWTPTLCKIDGEQTRAWTGLALAIQLVRIFGYSDAKRILASIGDSYKQSTEVQSNERHTILRALPGIVAGGIIVVGAISPANAVPSSNRKLDKDWVSGDAVIPLADAARRDSGVQSLAGQLKLGGFESAPEHDVAVIASGSAVTLLSFHNQDAENSRSFGTLTRRHRWHSSWVAMRVKL